MKKKRIITSLLLGLGLVSGLAACGGNTPKPETTPTAETPATPTPAATSNVPSTNTATPSSVPSEASTTTSSEITELDSYKIQAISKLDEIFNPVIAKITNDDLKAKVQEFYDTEKAYINDITDLETAKAAANKVVADTATFAKDVLLPFAIEKVNAIVNPLINQITNTELKTKVQTFYDAEMDKLEAVESLNDVVDLFKEVVDDTKAFIVSEIEKILIPLKNQALQELNTYLNTLLGKIPYDSVKTSLQTFYNTETAKLEAVNTLEGVEPCVLEIKSDLQSYAITEIVKAAKSNLETLINTLLSKLPDGDLKTSLQAFSTTELAYINGINDLDSASAVATKIASDGATYAKNTLKPIALTKLEAIIRPLINEVSDADLKASMEAYFDVQLDELSDINSLEDLVTAYNAIETNTKKFIKDELEKALIDLKNKALQELNTYVNTLIEKIPYNSVKTSLQTFYNTETAKLEAVKTLEGFAPCVAEIKSDLEAYVLTESKKVAIALLDELVDEGLDKLPNETLKNDLSNFADEEIDKLEAITKLEDVTTTLSTVLEETTAHIKGLLAGIVKGYFTKLTAIETATAYDYLPAAMAPSYKANNVTEAEINYDFTSFTNVSAIMKAGYGEQWQMVIENIEQSVTMAKVFNLAQTALNAAGEAVIILIENSYADEMSFNLEDEKYEGYFEFKNSNLIFNVKVLESVDFPVVGTVQPFVKMSYDIVNDIKSMFISLGDNYKIRYVISDNNYVMATTYGVNILGQSGSRTSYLSVYKNGTKTVGQIYEFTTLNESDKISACADFYVENGYVSVVGNKASGMTGFTGYISELYKANEGRLLGYEVKEEKEILGVKGTYNTLWFNLWDISGINTIKVTDKTDGNASSRSTVDVYLNDSTTLFSPTYNKKLVKTSRKYDIEYRSRFYYTEDTENKTFVAHEVLVPMMFIQEDNNIDSNFTSYPSDMLKDNGIDSSVTMSQADLTKLLNDYDNLIPIFEENKESMSSSDIISFLAQDE